MARDGICGFWAANGPPACPCRSTTFDPSGRVRGGRAASPPRCSRRDPAPKKGWLHCWMPVCGCSPRHVPKVIGDDPGHFKPPLPARENALRTHRATVRRPCAGGRPKRNGATPMSAIRRHVPRSGGLCGGLPQVLGSPRDAGIFASCFAWGSAWPGF
jgi:hypothetical protein